MTQNAPLEAVLSELKSIGKHQAKADVLRMVFTLRKKDLPRTQEILDQIVSGRLLLIQPAFGSEKPLWEIYYALGYIVKTRKTSYEDQAKLEELRKKRSLFAEEDYFSKGLLEGRVTSMDDLDAVIAGARSYVRKVQREVLFDVIEDNRVLETAHFDQSSDRFVEKGVVYRTPEGREYVVSRYAFR